MTTPDAIALPFDPFALAPEGRYLSRTQYDAIVQFFVDNGRQPDPAEVEAITGPPSPTPAFIDPPPDGFAGRDWGNPDWLQRLVRSQT